MDVPFFVTFSLILLLGRYLPFALPPTARAVLADNVAGPAARAAKFAVSVSFAGLTLLVSMECSGCHYQQQQQCPGVTMEGRALWLNSAALFLGMVLGGVAVALHPPAFVPPFVQVVIDHLTSVTETIATTAFAHDVCIFIKILKAKQLV
ncbi:uncharacterized protein LOC133895827 [Phragmites australis]|uniref:uncharacterized protein LOC133895827 n=1 Tax=Phragmites australis TaxID=29695 RepID=UPI002D7916AF|nr:uncharacterized protein LOC133895827 [Phragmites australis]